MQNRRDFLKMGLVGSAFLPTFANLIAKADQKASVVQWGCACGACVTSGSFR